MMRYSKFINLITIMVIALFPSCSLLKKASNHGLSSGYYKLDSRDNARKVYIDVTEGEIDIYPLTGNKPGKDKLLSVADKTLDSLPISPLLLRKQSLDIDLTTVLLKYRPSVYGLPQQLNTEFNAALYAGWRYDNYKLISKTDPLGKNHNAVTNLGYDFGVFAGPGATLVSPFTTNNKSTNEYSGMIIQTGIAGFLESDIASFGIAVGFDYLLNSDRKIWIYNNKPWVGFIVGIALN